MAAATSAFCAGCQAERPLEDLIAFWPVGKPAERRYVCRPIGGVAEKHGADCFRRMVATADIHVIARAA